MSAKNGHMEWWVNRKSRIGMSPIAKAPPKLPSGAEWWTEPPTAAPEPEFIEYAIKFHMQLTREMTAHSAGAQRHTELMALAQSTSRWIRKARQILHERIQAPERSDLHTTDGLLIAASRALHKMRSRIFGLGGEVDGEIEQIMQAVQARADGARRRRAMSASCPAPRSRTG